MPSLRELISIVDFGTSAPTVDTTYFPNSDGSTFWTGTSEVSSSTTAWYVHFTSGLHGSLQKSQPGRVRLVRGTPF